MGFIPYLSLLVLYVLLTLLQSSGKFQGKHLVYMNEQQKPIKSGLLVSHAPCDISIIRDRLFSPSSPPYDFRQLLLYLDSQKAKLLDSLRSEIVLCKALPPFSAQSFALLSF